jgi:hypothetical protein
MALFDKIIPDRAALLAEIEAFRQFLATNPRAERAHFLPFFAGHPQLCAYLGTLDDGVSVGTHEKTELSLWGDFTCDLVAGNVDDGAFVFIEFEDANEKSLFRPHGKRKNSYWGNRVEQGVSQVTDWLFRINSEGSSDQMERDFGARHIMTMGLVVVGRSSDVNAYDRSRLDWRSRNTKVGSSRLSIVTYDDLLAWLDGRVTLLRI